MKKGELNKAKYLYESVLSVSPKNKKAQNGLVLLKKPKNVEEMNNVFKVQYEELLKFYTNANFTEAIILARKILLHYPNEFSVWEMLGAAYFAIENFDEALKAFKKVTELNPKDSRGFNNLGLSFHGNGEFKKAFLAYKKALSIDPNYSIAHNNIGLNFLEQGKLDQAIDAYKKAVSITPKYSRAYNNLGIALNYKGDFGEAMQAFKKAISHRPDYAEAFSNMGLTLKNQGKYGEAIDSIKKALSYKPDYVSANSNLGFIYLYQGNLELGIETRKWRWKSKKVLTKISHLKLPEWDGKQSLDGKSILALGEQGPGDVIIWAPAVEYLKSLGGKVTIQCHAKLIELFEMSFTDIEIKPYDNEITTTTNTYDYYIPMETLFGYFCISKKKYNKSLNFSAPAQFKTDAFLFPKQDRIDFWKDRLNKMGKGPFLGISWKSPLMTFERQNNYTELSDWEPLFSLPNVKYINLQSTDFKDDLREIKKKYSVDVYNFDDLDQYDDFADVAALCAALDMCVSVSTAVSTVASAVGTPTRMLHWRQSFWNNVLFSPTGPDVKIYERNSWEPWSSCFADIANEVLLLKSLRESKVLNSLEIKK